MERGKRSLKMHHDVMHRVTKIIVKCSSSFLSDNTDTTDVGKLILKKIFPWMSVSHGNDLLSRESSSSSDEQRPLSVDTPVDSQTQLGVDTPQRPLESSFDVHQSLGADKPGDTQLGKDCPKVKKKRRKRKKRKERKRKKRK